jgi:hypothetical protein
MAASGCETSQASSTTAPQLFFVDSAELSVIRGFHFAGRSSTAQKAWPEDVSRGSHWRIVLLRNGKVRSGTRRARRPCGRRRLRLRDTLATERRGAVLRRPDQGITSCPSQRRATVDETLALLARSTPPSDTVAFVYLNRRLTLDFRDVVILTMGFRELWLIGAASPDQDNWSLFDDALTSLRRFDFEYPT